MYRWRCCWKLGSQRVWKPVFEQKMLLFADVRLLTVWDCSDTEMHKAACPWLRWGCQRYGVNAILQSIVTSTWEKEVHPDICTTEEWAWRRADWPQSNCDVGKVVYHGSIFVFCSSSILLHALCNLGAFQMAIRYPERPWKLPTCHG